MVLLVGYQGEDGAYSQQAILALFKNRDDILCVGHWSFNLVFECVNNGSINYGLVPIENNLGGSIHDNYDLLCINNNINIIYELDFRVEHCLMALDNVKLNDIKRIISHPQALAQCEDYIKKLNNKYNNNIKPEKQYDTAGSAKLIAEQKLSDTAAIASELAAKAYGLNILEKSIQDEQNNFTRFLLIAKDNANTNNNSRNGDDIKLFGSDVSGLVYKTSIVFSLIDESGALFKALSVFALRDIHLTRIESRPRKKLKQLLEQANNNNNLNNNFNYTNNCNTDDRFKYLFYIDFLCHSHETRAQNALGHLKEIAPFLRVLGSYPCANTKSIINIPNNNIATNIMNGITFRLNIGIVGFGTFGQFLANKFVSEGHNITACSRSDYTNIANRMGVKFINNYDEFASTPINYDVIILSVSILSFANTVKEFPWKLLNNSPLIVDVLSVKVHPKNVLLSLLPAQFDILCLHPMFGPESGRYSWNNLPCMYEKVRISNNSINEQRCSLFLSLFSRAGCNMLNMSCEQHDSYAAESQFLTHTTGRILSQLNPKSTPINTKGFQMLLELVKNTEKDSFELYKGLYVYNQHSKYQLDKFEDAFKTITHQLQNNDNNTAHSNNHNENNNLNNNNTYNNTNNNDSNTIHVPSINPRILLMNESKTVAITDLAKSMQSKGISVISLSVGELLDVNTPQPVIQATINALQSGNTKYTPVQGLLQLREAIANKLLRENNVKYCANEIIVSNGAKQCIWQAIAALSCEGDEIIIPAPYWVSYPDMCIMCGAKPIIVNTLPNNRYIMTPQQLQSAITHKTKLIILCSPCNPTGSVYTKDELLQLCNVILKYPNILVLSDEIYEHLTYDNNIKHISIASLPHMYDRTIIVNGFSKCYSMTGFRLGYLAAPKHLKITEYSNKIQGQITSCASSISQYAGIAAMNMDITQYKSDMINNLKIKRDLVVDILCSIPNVIIDHPLGAFYVLPVVSHYYGYTTPKQFGSYVINNSEELCMHLLQDYHVALVPGSAFGAGDTVRISYASDQQIVKEGVQRLKQCLLALIPPNK